MKSVLSTCLVLGAAVLGCDVPDGASGSDAGLVGAVDEHSAALRGRDAVRGTEPADPGGLYPETMNVYMDGGGGCTATVVAPHVVLTAHHCAGAQGGQGRVQWEGDAGVRTFTFTDSFPVPYKEVPYLPPAWLDAVDGSGDPQGLFDDEGRRRASPEQHDLSVLFVPDLNAAVIAEMGIVTPRVTPGAARDRYVQVGVTSGPNDTRQFVDTAFRMPQAGHFSFNGGVLDGVLYSSEALAEPGDSGGPTFGSRIWSWGVGAMVEGRRFLVGITQGGFNRAPLAFVDGMTPMQIASVELNQLWLKSRMADPDGDGVPDECDRKPTEPSGNACPPPIGGPIGSAVVAAPHGRLVCPPGFLATGLEGGLGAQLDRVAVRCSEAACVARGDAGCDSHWTASFGGSGGDDFRIVCGAGEHLTALGARHVPGAVIGGLTPRCSALDGSTRRSVEFDGAVPMSREIESLADCGISHGIRGLEVRSWDMHHVTGVQVVCGEDVNRLMPRLGGDGGQLSSLRCPDGLLAVGTVQASTGSAVGLFGLLCAPEGAVRAGVEVDDADRYVVWSGAHIPAEDRTWPGGEGPFTRNTANATVDYERMDAARQVVRPVAEPDRLLGFADIRPDDLRVHACRAGEVLGGFRAKHDSLVRFYYGAVCRPVDGGNDRRLNGSVGLNQGAYTAQSCPAGTWVDAIHVRAGWSLDAITMQCTSTCTPQRIGGRDHLVCSGARTAYLARDKCESQGMTLAQPTTGGEVDGLVAVMSANGGGDWWIGLDDRAREGTFVWADGSPKQLLPLWAAGEPNNVGGEDCVTLRSDGRLNDLDCGRARPFVCEEP